MDEPPRRRVYAHVETGDLYEMYPIRLETKNDLTGDWEKRLMDIEHGSGDREAFINGIKELQVSYA